MADQHELQVVQQQHTKRVEKRSTASHCLRKSLRWLNCFAILGSLLSIGAVLALRHPPTWTGWVLVSLAAVTIIAAILGWISSEACVSLRFLIEGLSSGELGAASFALLIKHQLVKERLKSELSYRHTHLLVNLITTLFLLLFCAQIVVLVLDFTLRRCDDVDYYEDLEVQYRNRRGRKNLAKVQEESELRAVKHEKNKTKEMSKKMKQKYGQWTEEGEFDTIK